MAKGTKETDSPFVFKVNLNGRLSSYSVIMRELPIRQSAKLAAMDQNDPANVLLIADLLDEYCVEHDLPGIGKLSEVGTNTATKILAAWLAGNEDAAVPPAEGGV